MKTSEKLQIIRQLSGLTQEKLAQRLGVSFVTVNSWIHGLSHPRKKAEQRIDELFGEYSGQRLIPKNKLDAKKQILMQKSREQENIIKKIVTHHDLYDAFLLSLTYNTNSIEGSTLSENETAGILFLNTTYPSQHLIEHLEGKNRQGAFGYLMRYLQDQKTIDEDLILRLHGMLMNGIRDDAGFYRKHGVRIVGANIPTANHLRVPELMTAITQDIKKGSSDTCSHIAEIHARFEKIHPFSDGNGRIGRLIIHAMALLQNLPPAIFHQEQKHIYYSALQKAQQKEDFSLLEDFLCDAFLEGFQLINEV